MSTRTSCSETVRALWIGTEQRDGVADGLGKGVVPGIQLDEDGALWAATEGGISRIKGGRVATSTSANGLPCDTIHGTMWDDSGALWASAQRGLIRIARTELETWVAHPTRRIETPGCIAGRMPWDFHHGQLACLESAAAC